MRLLKIFITFLLFIGHASVYAQKQGQALIDSFLKELPRAKDDTNKVNLLTRLSFEYASNNPDEGIRFGLSAVELARKLNWKKGIAIGENAVGESYGNRSDYGNALAHHELALKMGEKIGDRNIIAEETGNVGLIYYYEDDYPKALEYYFKALKIKEKAGNNQEIVTTTSNIALVYFKQSNYAAALEYDFRALKLGEEARDKQMIATITGNIACIYREQKDYVTALEYSFKALKLDKETGDKLAIATCIANIGAIYSGQRSYALAMDWSLKALKMYEEIGAREDIAITTRSICGIFTEKGDYVNALGYGFKALKLDEAIGSKGSLAADLANIGDLYLSLSPTNVSTLEVKNRMQLAGIPAEAIPKSKKDCLRRSVSYLERGLSIGREINAPETIRNCYEALAKAYKTDGDYKKSLDALENYTAVRDSIFSNENSRKTIRIGMAEEYRRKRLTDSLMTDETQKVTELRFQKQKTYTYMGLAGVALLGAFGFYIVRNNKLLSKEKNRSEDLLLNILPVEIANELKEKGNSAAKYFDHVTVIFTDFVNFTNAGERMTPHELVKELDSCFKAFDQITSKYRIEKIKTIGDAYLAVSGLPVADAGHAENMVRAAIEINAFMRDRVAKLGDRTFEVRIGIHSGSVVAGIVGIKKFAYDIWGDTVNTAARMEQNSTTGRINISESTYELVKDKFTCEYRGEIDAKNKGQMKMYYVG